MRARLLLLFCLTAAVSLADGRRYALFIGINDYTATEIADLRFAVADVTSLADALTTTPALAFAKDDVFLMTDTVKDAAYLPKQANILVRLDLLRQQLKADDLFLFYFAGHGLEYEGEYYLLTQDSDIRAKTALERSALRLSDVRKLLDTIPSRQRLLFFDACREDPRAGSRGAEGQNVLSEVFVRGVRPRLETGETTRNELTASFFATQQGQRSYEWPSQGHGFFSYYLAQGLRGEAAQVDGRLTLDSLEAYLAQAVPAATRREINQLQTPWVDRSGAGGAELVLAVYPPRNLEQVAGSAKLKVLSTPPGAPVIVDNEMVGVTPCEAEVDLAGQPERVVEIAVTRQGYRTEMRRLKLTRGQVAEVDVGEMVRRPVRQVLTGSLAIRTDPPGAQVILDGLEAGKTPFTDPFSTAGTHRVALLLAGRATAEREVTVAAGKETALDLKLEAQPATLIVDTTPPGATVLVNGEKRGETPVAVSQLPPGEYTVELVLNGFETQRTTVGLAAGVVVPIKAVMVSAQAGDALADPVFDRRVTVKALNQSFRALLGAAAADAKVNLVVDDSVTERAVTLALNDAPLRDVCRVLMVTYGLQVVHRGDVYAVVPKEADFGGGTVVKQGTAELLVETEPEGATVEWDGQPIGTTPLRFVTDLGRGSVPGVV